MLSMNLSIEPNTRITYGIAYQDEHVLVIEKPAHVPTQPGKGHQTDTLLNALFAQFGQQLQNLGKSRDFGLLHRLDKETSGLLIVGLRTAAYDALREQFMSREIKKYYWAVCDGVPKKPSGVIKLPIAEGKGSEGKGPKKLAHISRVSPGMGGGKIAITAYRVLEQSDSATMIEARPITGRLHQIRVHLEAIGCPILGDTFYGPRRVHAASPRVALHSHRVTFTHPVTGQIVDVRTDWPNDLRRLLKAMRLHRPTAKPASPIDIPEVADDTPDA